jgi:hypothetical protein
VLAWPLLRLVGVRPAWPVVLVAAAAVLTEPGARPLRTVGLAALLIAVYPAASAWNGRQQAGANAASLEATHLPLLAAELSGYRIAQAGAVNPGEWTGYRLVPDSAPPELTPSLRAWRAGPATARRAAAACRRSGPAWRPAAFAAGCRRWSRRCTRR